MFDFLFNPNGRISRKGYALGWALPYYALVAIPGLFLVSEGLVQVYLTVIGLFFLWPSAIAVQFKRFHDLGATGWLHVAIMILGFGLGFFGSWPILAETFSNPEAAQDNPFAGMTGLETQQATFARIKDAGILPFAALIASTAIQYGETLILLLLPGQRQENKYGQDPLISGRGFAD